jgi:tight adherence protein B
MTLALLTFFATLTIVLGSYWAVVARPEAQVSGRVRQRLFLKVDHPIGAESVMKGGPSRQAGAGLLGTLVNWHQRYAVASAARLIESAGMRTDPARLIAGTAIALTANIIVLSIMNAGTLVTLIVGLLTPLAPYAYVRRAAHARLRAFEEIFPDAISLMARALRAGHALTTTLSMVADEVQEPVKSEFRALSEQHQYGLPLPQVLRTFARRIPAIDVRFFVTAVLTQRETGGNLAEVLDNLGTVTRDRSRVRQQLRVLTAQGRMTGWILAALPLVLGGILYLFNPVHVNAFVKDPLGLRMLEAALVLEAIGAVLIQKIVSVEY